MKNKQVKELWKVSVSVGRHSLLPFTTYQVIASTAEAASRLAVKWAIEQGLRNVRTVKCEHAGLVLP